MGLISPRLSISRIFGMHFVRVLLDCCQSKYIQEYIFGEVKAMALMYIFYEATRAWISFTRSIFRRIRFFYAWSVNDAATQDREVDGLL